MFLEDITITFIEPCFAESNKIRFKAETSTGISDILPYLNSVLKNATYNKHVPNLVFVKNNHLFTLSTRQVTVTKALNETEAWQLMDWLKDFINDIYSRRDEITPDHEMRAKPTPLQIYTLLPRTNCKLCGEPTCLAFAAKLIIGEKTIDKCRPLFTEEYEKLRSAMKELMIAIGNEMPE